MISELIESLAGLVEFAIEAATIPIRHRRTQPRVGDRFRATTTVSLPAVFRPLTPASERIQLEVRQGSRWRVELALPAADRSVYLATLEPLDHLGLSPTELRRALADGLWLEVPGTVLGSTFRSL